MGDFMAEDGGEAVFAGADGEEAAEDEDFAAAKGGGMVSMVFPGDVLFWEGDLPWNNKSVHQGWVVYDVNFPFLSF